MRSFPIQESLYKYDLISLANKVYTLCEVCLLARQLPPPGKPQVSIFTATPLPTGEASSKHLHRHSATHRGSLMSAMAHFEPSPAEKVAAVRLTDEGSIYLLNLLIYAIFCFPRHPPRRTVETKDTVFTLL